MSSSIGQAEYAQQNERWHIVSRAIELDGMIEGGDIQFVAELPVAIARPSLDGQVLPDQTTVTESQPHDGIDSSYDSEGDSASGSVEDVWQECATQDGSAEEDETDALDLTDYVEFVRRLDSFAGMPMYHSRHRGFQAVFSGNTIQTAADRTFKRSEEAMKQLEAIVTRYKSRLDEWQTRDGKVTEKGVVSPFTKVAHLTMEHALATQRVHLNHAIQLRLSVEWRDVHAKLQTYRREEKALACPHGHGQAAKSSHRVVSI